MALRGGVGIPVRNSSGAGRKECTRTKRRSEVTNEDEKKNKGATAMAESTGLLTESGGARWARPDLWVPHNS
jgi:hypothetical protein